MSMTPTAADLARNLGADLALYLSWRRKVPRDPEQALEQEKAASHLLREVLPSALVLATHFRDRVATAEAEVIRLQGIVESLAARCAGQSELLAAKAGKKDEDAGRAAHCFPDVAPVEGQVYRHWKGGLYVVLALSVKEDTLEQMVTYRSLQRGNTWARTLKDWSSLVAPDVPRFVRWVQPVE